LLRLAIEISGYSWTNRLRLAVNCNNKFIVFRLESIDFKKGFLYYGIDTGYKQN